MPITAVIGPFGSGKTCLMTKRGYRHHLRGRRVLTNYHVNFPHKRVDLAWLLNALKSGTELMNCVLLLDEFHILMDSYDGMGNEVKLLSYIITQTRKRGVSVIITTQHEMQIHVRMRRFVDNWCFCEGERPRKRRNLWPHKFLYRRYDGLTLKYRGGYVFDGRPVYHLYDTRETITDFAHKVKPHER